MKLAALIQQLLDRQLMVATAESCTAGLVAKLLTDMAGSSQWFERGFVTYSNLAKQQMLGVNEQTLQSHGAVSQQTVTEMVTGALHNSPAHIALAITGIAGPDGGSADKPVGTVWFAWAHQDGHCRQAMHHFDGDRSSIRQQAAEFAIDGLLDFLDSHT